MRFLVASTLILASFSSLSAMAAEGDRSCGVVRELVSNIKTKHRIQVHLETRETHQREVHTIGVNDADIAMLTRAVGSPNVEVCLKRIQDGQSTVTNLYAPTR